jgi:hypothetical protein
MTSREIDYYVSIFVNGQKEAFEELASAPIAGLPKHEAQHVITLTKRLAINKSF